MKRAFFALTIALLAFGPAAHAARFNADQEAKTADKGPYPWEYESIVKQFISDVFYDPTSLVDFEVTRPSASWWRDAGFGKTKERTTFCWGVIFTANARNRMGGYVGKKVFFLYIRDARLLGHFEQPWGPATDQTFNRLKAQGEASFREEWARLTPEQQQKAQLLLQPDKPGAEAKAADLTYIEELKALAALREQGVITEEEFNAKKRQLLGLEENAPAVKPPGI